MAVKLTVCLFFFVCYGVALKLEKVLMLSRHNLRHPLTGNLQQYSSHIWPVSNYTPGYLTPKGNLLETYMGEYLSNWLKAENILSEKCIENDKNVFIYANTRQRTRQTARAFADGAFSNCNVSVYSLNSTEMDPIFNPIFRNTSSTLKEVIIKEIKKKLQNLNLQAVYSDLENILDIQKSEICKNTFFCSFTNSSDEIIYKIGEEPGVKGPLNYANFVVDAFLMAYYEGEDIKNIAWGQIKTKEQLHSLVKITRANQMVRFQSHNLAKEVANPLINYIYDAFLTDKKFILLVGHDSNIESVMGAFDFKTYVLPDQDENTPIGGKLVFQKWFDEVSNERLLKIQYVYQTTEQLRNGSLLSDKNPPRWATLEITLCPTNQNGFCSWEKFIEILKNIK